MLIIKTLDTTLGVNFSHPHNDSGKRATICHIYKDINGEWAKDPLAVGQTVCSKKDNFSKAVGRKKALERALLENKKLFSRRVREIIWEAYWKVCQR